MKGSVPNVSFGDESKSGQGVNLSFDVSAPRPQDLGNTGAQPTGDLYGGDQGTDDLYGDEN